MHPLTQVENFTVSFSDGRALCCLLHHYHPALLPLDRIHFHTSQSLQEAAERAEEGAADSEDELSQDWGAGPFGGLCSIVCVCVCMCVCVCVGGWVGGISRVQIDTLGSAGDF